MISRRRLLKLGLLAGAAGATGVALDHVLPSSGPSGAFFSARERRIFSAVCRRLLVGDETDMPDPVELGALEFVDRFLADSTPAVQQDVHRCLQAAEHLTLVSGIGMRPFTRLGDRDQERYLRWLSTSSFDSTRTILAALRSLAAMGYYRHPRTWELIGYTGPVAPPGFDVYGGSRPRQRLARPHAGTLEADVVVVGTGAGGLMMAAELASAGKSVLALEEGEHLTHLDFNQREDEMVPAIFQDRGGRATPDLSIRILQGRGIGGSTVHNTNLCKRAPSEILARWESELGMAGLAASLEPHYMAVEQELGVVPIPDEMVNRNNQKLLDGARGLGWRTARLHHNRKDCVGAGFCELGCPFDAKENALKILLPRALAHGARVLPGVHVERVLLGNRRAYGVVATLATARGRREGTLVVRARAVCLAGSAIGSAAVALASGLPDPHRQIGRHLHLHPGVAVVGIFGEPIEGWGGIPQSIECTEKLDLAPGARDRTWIVPAFAHPISTASLTPGVGREHARAMREYARTAVLVAMLHDESEGIVVLENGHLRVRYALDAPDRRALARGVRACGSLLLAAGARKVVVPSSPPVVAQSERQLDAVGAHTLAPLVTPLIAAHPMGTLRMSRDASIGVVDAAGRHHRVPNLFVCDGSLFPTSIGGPPQLSIYALARHVSRTVIDALS